MQRNDIVNTIKSLKGETGHKKVLEVYNSQDVLPRDYKMQSSDAWCAATVSAVFLMNGYDGFSECSCLMMIQKAKQLGIWEENDAYVPSPGDVIMYDWQDQGTGDGVGVADHVGIVIDVEGNNITVREGNYSHTIKNRTIKVNGRYIRGYILPPYDEIPSVVDIPPKKEESDSEELPYKVGQIYTIKVNTSLNVRNAPGKENQLVGYNNLTADGRKHATKSGALLSGTKVTCEEVMRLGYDNVWIKIPSGWICAIEGNRIYVI